MNLMWRTIFTCSLTVNSAKDALIKSSNGVAFILEVRTYNTCFTGCLARGETPRSEGWYKLLHQKLSFTSFGRLRVRLFGKEKSVVEITL